MPPEQQTSETPQMSGATPASATPEPFTPHGAATQEDYASPGWSWGAFMMGPFFMIAVRKYVLLWLYVLMFIPIVNFFAQLGIAIFMGVKGRAYAAESSTFSSKEQYIGFMKAVDHAGKIAFFIVLAAIVIGVAVAVSIGAALFGSGQGRMTDDVYRVENALDINYR